MSKENPLWGASRIHGELLMLGFEVAQSTVSKYLVCGGGAAVANLEDIFAESTRRRSPLSICALAGGNCCGSR